MISQQFWRGKRVLVTGHTGFKGSWLSLMLQEMGAIVQGYSLSVPSKPSLFEDLGGDKEFPGSDSCDVRDLPSVSRFVADFRPEIVFHLAAQSLVREGYRAPYLTIETNVMGTLNVLESIKGVSSVEAVVVVTSDKVYSDMPRSGPYSEDDRLGGQDPYSASKAATEMAIQPYFVALRASQGVGISSARAGNVVGGGDWSTDRLFADLGRAWSKGSALQVRNRGHTRPWQHVLDALGGYVLLAERLASDSTLPDAFNFGPSIDGSLTVEKVLEIALSYWPGSLVEFVEEVDAPAESPVLLVDSTRANDLLGFSPRWQFEETVKRTVSWYRQFEQGISARELCRADIEAYFSSPWTVTDQGLTT
jgi:CDP-glucose 4,6-dehydratase